MDAKGQVRTQDQEPRAKDQPHDLFDYYTNTKNALAGEGAQQHLAGGRVVEQRANEMPVLVEAGGPSHDRHDPVGLRQIE